MTCEGDVGNEVKRIGDNKEYRETSTSVLNRCG